MALFPKADPVRKLHELLDREHTALCRGDLTRLTDILPEKEQLLRDIQAKRPVADRLVGLRDDAERNQRLLEAATAGIAAALSRLDSLTSAQRKLVTYDRNGRLTDESDGATHHRRA